MFKGLDVTRSYEVTAKLGIVKHLESLIKREMVIKYNADYYINL